LFLGGKKKQSKVGKGGFVKRGENWGGYKTDDGL